MYRVVGRAARTTKFDRPQRCGALLQPSPSLRAKHLEPTELADSLAAALVPSSVAAMMVTGEAEAEQGLLGAMVVGGAVM